jgi:DNA-directed RNA polymerase specialized sigma24 family protein
MSTLPNARAINLQDLSSFCQRESELFFQHRSFDPRYCFELFRRAFMERCQQAWEYVYAQYRLLVLAWIEHHSMFAGLDEEADYFVNRAFEKMWLVVTPRKFGEFPDLRSLLRYLQLCVHSVIVDHARLREQAALWDEDVEPASLAFADPPEPGDSLEDQVARRQQARVVWQALQQRLKTPQEQTAAFALFSLNLKPRQILEEFPGVFGSVDEIYTIKENVLDRLRRDEDLLRLLSNLEQAKPVLPKGKHTGKTGSQLVNRGR